MAELAGWHELFLLLGGAAAALIGLLFVAASLHLDFLYLLAYGAFLALACAATRDLAAERGWHRMAVFGTAAVPLAIAGALFDAIEDVFLLRALEGKDGELAPHLGAIFAGLKFAALTVVLVYIVAGLVLRLRDRRRAS